MYQQQVQFPPGFVEACDRTFSNTIANLSQCGRIPPQMAQAANNVYATNRASILSAVYDRVTMHMTRNITVPEIEVDVAQTIVPKVLAQLQGQMTNGFQQNPYGYANPGGYYQMPIQQQPIAYNIGAVQGGWQPGVGSTPQQPQPTMQPQQPAAQSTSVTGTAGSVVTTTGGVVAPNLVSQKVDPETYQEPTSDGLSEHEQPVKLDAGQNFRLTSDIVIQKADGTRINNIHITCLDFRCTSIDQIKRKIANIPAITRGDKYFITYQFYDPSIWNISLDKLPRHVSCINKILESEDPKLKTPLAKVRGIKYYLNGEPRGEAEEIEKLLVSMINTRFHHGALCDDRHPYLLMSIKSLDGLANLMDPQTSDATIKKCQEEVTGFVKTLETISMQTMLTNLLHNGGLAMLQFDGPSKIAAVDDILPRFIVDGVSGQLTPQADFFQLYLESEVRVGNATTVEADKAKQKLIATSRNLTGRCTIILRPRVVMETNLDPYDLFRLNEKGSITPFVTGRRTCDLVCLTSRSVKTLKGAWAGAPCELRVIGNACQMQLAVGKTSDDRTYFGSK